MSDVPPEIRELISTPIRKEIFITISAQKDGFTKQELFASLKKNNIQVSLALVQNLLKALCYRGYLHADTLKVSKTAGRSTIHYRKSSR